MSLELQYTIRGLAPSVKDNLRRAIEPHFGEISESEIFLASDDPPTWVTLVGQLLTWKAVLAIPATAFLKRIAEHAADEVWNRREAIGLALRDAPSKVLREIAEAIEEAQRSAGNNFHVTLQFSLPDGFYGTRLSLPSESVEDVAWYVAHFVARADAIHAFVEGEIPSGSILGPVQLELLEDGGFVVVWQTLDFKMHSHAIR